MTNELSTVRRSLAPTTYAEAFEFAQHLAKSSMVPAEYRGKPENILLAMQWGMEIGLAPLQAIQNIAIINGKPSVYGDALLAMVKGSPVCDDVIEHFEGADDGLVAVCDARRVGKAPVIARFSVADAKRAGLWGKAGPWTQYPKRMLQWRARGFALRDAFPDVLRGVITAEEAADYPKPREPIDVTPLADLDAFANGVGMPAPQAAAETGVRGDDDALRILAEQTAMLGAAAFREWWKTLDAGQRDALRPDLAEYQRVAAAADASEAGMRASLALAVEADSDPFGLPPAPDTEQSSPVDGPAERPGASAPADSPTRQGEPSAQPWPGPVPDEANLVVPLPPTRTATQLEYYARQLLAMIAEKPLTAQRAALIRAKNEGGIGWLKLKAVEQYDAVQRALNQKVEAV